MRRLACLILVSLAATPALSQSREPLAPKTLDRPLSPVVIPGSRLKPLLKTPGKQLRLYAVRPGKQALAPIPFQVDQRTPEERYAFTRGAGRRSDTDDGLLDANDELVFMARDAGARIPRDAIRLGQTSVHEVEIKTRDGKQGWVYLARFAQAPPPIAKARYVTLDRRGGEVVGWSTSAVRLRSDPLGGNVLAFRSLEFAHAKGWGPNVLDRLKLDLEAHYLYLTIRRRMDEIRSELTSTLEGPVRVVAGFSLEAYLIYGHWMRTTKRCLLRIYPNHIEVEVEFALPVALEKTKPSRMRLSLDFAPRAGALKTWSDRNLVPLTSRGKGTAEALRALKRKRPTWACVSTPQGSVLGRVEPATELTGRHTLHLTDDDAHDPPEDVRGSHTNTGVNVDLTSLQRGSYSFKLSLVFGPPLKAASETKRLLRLHQEPLSGTIKE